MPYKTFKAAVYALASKYGLTVKECKHDCRKHFAKLSNGLNISGNEEATSIEFWNHNHKFRRVSLDELRAAI